MKKSTEFLISGLVVLILVAAGGAGIYEHQNAQSSAQNAGNYNPTGGGTYYLKSPIATTDTSITLQSFTEPVSNIPYTMTYLNSTVEYGTIDPYSTLHREFISFTGITQNSDGSATLTGVTRGIEGTYPYQASTTLAQIHGSNTYFVLSNPPQLTNQYLNLNSGNSNVAYSSNQFASTTFQGFDGDPGATYFTNAASSTFIDQAQLSRAILTGCTNASQSTNGCVQLATARQAASSTVTGSSGANDVLWSKYATDTPGVATSSVVMSLMGGKIAQGWLDLTQAFTFSGLTTFTNGLISSASSTIAANASNKLSLNGLAYIFPSVRGASSTVLSEDGTGKLSYESEQAATIYTNSNVGTSFSSTATTTILTIAIPANTLNTSNTALQGTFTLFNTGNCVPSIAFGSGTATTTIGGLIVSNNVTNGEQIAFTLTATSSTSEMGVGNGFSSSPLAGAYGGVIGFPTVNIAATSYIAVQAANCGSGSITLIGANVVAYSH